MILFVTAFHAEAKALIDAWSLKRECDAPFPSYFADGYALVVGGMGKIAAAGALGYWIGRFGAPAMVVNVGIAAVTDASVPVGSAFLAESVTDYATGRTFYPDLLFASPFATLPLETRDTPLIASDDPAKRLIDMEGSALLGIGAKFLPPHALMFLKIVSDYGSDAVPAKETVEGWIAPHVRNLREMLNGIQTKLDPFAFERSLLERLSACLRLTQTQRVHMRTMIRYARFSGLDDGIFEEAMSVPVADKAATKRVIETLERQIFE